jgi:hypothetical protein
MSRKQLERRINRSPALQLVRDEARRRLAERALEKLQDHLERGEPWAIRYVLAHVGHLVNWGTPPVRIAPHEDPTAILARLDALEQELAGVEIPLHQYLALLELRRAAVADLRRIGEIEPIVEELVSAVQRVVESTIEDPETRTELLRRLVEVFERGARGRVTACRAWCDHASCDRPAPAGFCSDRVAGRVMIIPRASRIVGGCAHEILREHVTHVELVADRLEPEELHPELDQGAQPVDRPRFAGDDARPDRRDRLVGAGEIVEQSRLVRCDALRCPLRADRLHVAVRGRDRDADVVRDLHEPDTRSLEEQARNPRTPLLNAPIARPPHAHPLELRSTRARARRSTLRRTASTTAPRGPCARRR